MSIRSRLLILVTLATLIPAVLVGLRFLEDRATSIGAAGESLSEVANLVLRDLDAKVRGTSQLLYGLARARDVATDEKDLCSAFLSNVREQNPQYTGILTIQPDGELFCDSLRSGRKLNLSDRNYFQRALSLGDGVTLEAVFGRLTGLAVLQIAEPARTPSGAVDFVLLASFNLQKFVEGFGDQLERAQILLVKNDGMVLAWQPNDKAATKAGTSIKDTGLFQHLGTLASSPAGGGPGATVFQEGAMVWAVADSAVTREAGLHILVGRPKSELFADANQGLLEDTAMLVGVLVLLFAGVWAFAEFSIRRQIVQIAGMMGKLGQGDLAARIPAPYPKGDLGKLMALLNETAQSLEQQRNEIEDLHRKLRQSQKMEAIGHLTGGVAHDFNNLLTVVIGNAETLADQLADKPGLKALADMSGKAAARGAELTKQLLAFARRQPLNPKAVDIAQLLDGMEGLLRRSLGGQVALRSAVADDLWPALIDPHELENAILNLCINARDAMADGGRITLEAGNLSIAAEDGGQHGDLAPGDYVTVAVTDTGIGMDRATLERAFEPFFTTKEVGRGSGLGLSMVYGFVKQSKGHVQLYSEPGRGTVVRLYLPRALTAGEIAAPAEPSGSLPRGSERILLVEDDENVRSFVANLLLELGYRVLATAGAREALAALAAQDDFDLVFTDVVMPGDMNGVQLAEAIRARNPALPILFTSGYSEKEVQLQGKQAPHFIAKPYRRHELATKLRQVLEASRL
ncbi:ATP-binding protein [Dongia rigui]|uniref:histidine kinase n=1 Tax=Dongia rigui TaxID=940149 RepID=A0ABU5DTE6_9PROT|nr:ATP-binding protein [Dongia rigui]MDY0870290.1 response regulator [Dongia rigui]